MPIKFDILVLQEMLGQTIDQMADGGLDNDTFEAFCDFTADYPANAWLDDYRRYGGIADDDQAYEVEKALMDLARDRLT